MSGEQFSLVWNTFPRNLSSELYNLLTGEQLVDVTLAAEGQIFRAHKLILSVCSTYFRDLFKVNSCKHPIVILKDVNYRDLSAMLHFMYQGEVNIKQEDIASFLKVAEVLQIKGLTKNNEEESCEREVETLERPTVEEQRNDSVTTSVNGCCTNIISEITPNIDIPEISSEKANDDTITHEQEIDTELKQQEYLDTESEISREEPLDCTLDYTKLSQPERDWNDYKSGIKNSQSTTVPEIIEKQTEHQIDPRIIRDSSPNSQVIYHPHSYQELHPNLEKKYEFTAPHQNQYQNVSGSSSNRGRRTVKGIPGSSLSLETTLRVISELGPTIRVERGKIVRMYSCPWCLRHFTRKENLKLHVRYIHGPLESLTCKLCGNKYKNSNSLRVHSYLYHNTKRNKHNKSPLVSGTI